MTEASKPKKLLYIITKSNFGGAQRYVLELAIAMRSRGFVVAVACGGRGELVTHLEAAGIEVFEITGAQRDVSALAELKALKSLYAIICNFAPDIVHLNSSKMGVLGSIVARLSGVPQIVFTAHGWPHLEPRPKSWKAMAWLGSFLTTLFVHKIICVSQNDYKAARSFLAMYKTVMIHNAITPFQLMDRTSAREALFNPEFIAAHNHQIWVVTHGELNHNKNHTTAIDAIAEFNTTHSTKLLYVIIGSGDTKAALLDQVSLRGLTDQVYFMDHVVAVREYLLAFDIYLMPSLKEGLPYSLLEAGYAGLPVIASNVGGIPEVIINQETGCLIEPQNHMTIVSALSTLLTESEIRIAYTTALSEHLQKYFTSKTMESQTLACYELGK